MNIHETLQNSSSKQDYTKKLFTRIAPEYNIITKLLSFGQDARWKKKFINAIPQSSYSTIVDLACGTGDLTQLLAKRFTSAHVYGVDLTPLMIEHAKKLTSESRISFICHDMAQLPFNDRSCQLVTGGYALRNASDLPKTLQEIARVLQTGGYASFLDFAKPQSTILQKINYYMLYSWGSLWGIIMHRDPSVYNYIAQSLLAYPDQVSFDKLCLSKNLKLVRRKRLFGGITEIVTLQRL